MLQDFIEDPRLLARRQYLNWVAETRRGLLGRVLGGGFPSVGPEYKSFGERVATETVGSIHAHTSNFTCRVKSSDSGEPVNICVNSTHHVVLARPNGDRLMDGINPKILFSKLLHEWQLLIDYFL